MDWERQKGKYDGLERGPQGPRPRHSFPSPQELWSESWEPSPDHSLLSGFSLVSLVLQREGGRGCEQGFQLPGPHPERKYTEGGKGIPAVARREVRNGVAPAQRAQGGAAWSLQAPGEGLHPAGQLAGGNSRKSPQSWATQGLKGPSWGDVRATP